MKKNNSFPKTKHWLYGRYIGIITRCNSPKSKYYHYYGGRGISVYPRWEKDFFAFAKHVLNLPLSESVLACGFRDRITIDRINNNGNYEPGNLRWATQGTQMKNRRPGKEWKMDYRKLSEKEQWAELIKRKSKRSKTKGFFPKKEKNGKKRIIFSP